jgi:hypothetical protein
MPVYDSSQLLISDGLRKLSYYRPAALADFYALPVGSVSYLIALI